MKKTNISIKFAEKTKAAPLPSRMPSKAMLAVLDAAERMGTVRPKK